MTQSKPYRNDSNSVIWQYAFSIIFQFIEQILTKVYSDLIPSEEEHVQGQILCLKGASALNPLMSKYYHRQANLEIPVKLVDV